MSGSSGCNQFTGGYKRNENTIQFGPLAMTKTACEPAIAQQEQRFLDGLSNARRLTLGGNRLSLVDDSNDHALVFIRVVN